MSTAAEAPGGRLFLRVFPSIMLPMFLASVDGTIVAAYHEWSDDEKPLQYCRATRFTL